jgi:hypothetical protein
MDAISSEFARHVAANDQRERLTRWQIYRETNAGFMQAAQWALVARAQLPARRA